MSNFITIEDYSASIHREILDALIREDVAIIEMVEDRAISEMRGYLSRRYDVDAIFFSTGKSRNDLILMLALDIAIYHIFTIHNPQKLSAVRTARYERAIEYLKGVSKGELSIEGAPLLSEKEQQAKSTFVVKSNPKRINHY